MSNWNLIDEVLKAAEKHGIDTDKPVRELVRALHQADVGILSDGDRKSVQRDKQAAARKRPGGGSFAVS
jgi:hypothetical protein